MSQLKAEIKLHLERSVNESIKNKDYILNVIFYVKEAILVAVYFSVQNTELSRDLSRALGRGYVCVRLKWSLLTYVCVTSVMYLDDIKRGKSTAGLFQDLR